MPLTLEGPTWTMRDVPAPVAVIFIRDRRIWRECDDLVLLVWRALGRYGGDWLQAVPGKPCAAAAASVGPSSEGRERSCRPATARPPATLAAYDRSPCRSTLPGCSRHLA